MAKKIVLGIEIDTSQPQKSIQKLTDHINDLNHATGDFGEDIETLNKEVKKLEKTGKKATKGMSAGFKGLGKSVGTFLKSLGIVGLVVAAFQQLKEALGRNQKAADFLSTAGTALEIVLDSIVQKGIIPLAEWLGDLFTDPLQSLKDFGKSIKEFVTDRFDGIINLVPTLGKALSALFKGEFAEAAKIAKGGFAEVKEDIVEFGKEVKETVGAAVDDLVEYGKETLKAAEAQTALTNAAELAEAQRAKAQLEFQKRAEEQRQIRDDESQSIAKRMEANVELGKILEEQAAFEKTFADQRLAAAQAAEARNKGNIQLVKEVIEAETQLAEIEERIAGQRSEQLVNEISLKKEGVQVIFDEIDAETELTNTLETEESKRIENEIAAAEAKLVALEEAGLMENELYALQLQEKALLEAEHSVALGEETEKRKEAEIKAQEDIKKARQATIQQGLAAASSFAGALTNLTNTIFQNELDAAQGNEKEQEKIRKKAFEANKALGIVQAVISTAQAVISGFNAGASLGPAGVVMGPVMAALAGVTGAIQIAAIAASKYTPSGGGSGSSPRGIPKPPAIQEPDVPNGGAPNVSFVGTGGGLNTVGGGVEESQPVTVNANVSISETEITGTQETVTEYENASLLEGG